MSSVIEDRIVEMKFDNSNFEKNVATSMNTLDRLKQALNFSNSDVSFKGIQKAAEDINSISFNGISDSLSAIRDRFSTMGIIGMTIIQNLTSSALGAIANVGHKFFGMISEGGVNRAMNIEKAKFQLEGLGIAYKDVYDEIDYAVTNTSFSLDAAAQAAAQLSSAGLDYDNVILTHQKDQKEITEMGMALRAVSGVAAQTMTDYGMVARYFQDVANAGKVTGATLTYMTQVLNLPVKQDLAEGLMAIADGSYEATDAVRKNAEKLVGNMQVSAQDVEKFCKDSQIDFDTFSTIMFNKYADHAVEANRTLTGVIDNIKSAFSRIGAEFVQPIIEIDGAVVHMLEAFRKKVNEFKGYIVPFAKLTTDSINTVAGFMESAFKESDIRWVEPFFTGLGGVIKGVTWILLEIGHAFKQVFPSALPEKLKTFSEGFKTFGENFGETFSKFTGLHKIYDFFSSFFNLIKSFGNILNIFIAPVKSFIQAFKDTASVSELSLSKIASSFDKLADILNTSQKLKDAAETMSRVGAILGQTFKGIINGIITAIQSLRSGGIEGLVDDIFNHLFREIGDGIIYLVEAFTGKDLSNAFKTFNKAIDSLRDFFSRFINVCKSGIGSLKDFISQLKENFGSFNIDTSGFTKLVDDISTSFNPLDSILTFVSNAFTVFTNFIRSTIPVIASVGKGLISGIKSLFKGIADSFRGSDLSEALKNTSLVAIVYQIKNLFIQINKLIGGTNPFKGLSNALTNLTDLFYQQAKAINAQYFLSIGASLLVLATAMAMIAGIDADRLDAAVSIIIVLMAEMAIISKVTSSSTSASMVKSTSALIAMAAAVDILASAMKKIAEIEDTDSLIRSLVAIEVMVVTMAGVAKLLSSTKSTSMIEGATGLIAMALAIKILASTVEVFKDMEWEELGKAGASIGALLVALGAFVKFTSSKESSGIFGSNSKSISADKMISIGVGLIALAAAIKIFASAAEDFSEMDWEQLGKAGASITVLMVELTAFTKIASGSTQMVAAGVGMIALAAAMKVFASAASDFANLDWSDLGKAGAAITGIVAAIAVLSKVTSSSYTGFFSQTNSIVKSNGPQNLIVLGIGMIAIAEAMTIFASAAESFGSLNWDELAKAGVSLAGIITALSLFSHFSDGGNMLQVSAAMLVFAAALLVLTPAIMAFSNLSIGGVVVSLLEVAGIIAILAVAAKQTEAIQGSMIKLSAAIGIFGLALIALGAGLTTLSAGVTAAVAAIPAIVLLIKEAIKGVIEAITESVPAIVEMVLKIIAQVLDSLEGYIPEMVDSVINLVIRVIDVLTTRVPELVSSIKSFISAIVEAAGLELSNVDPVALIAFAVGISAFMVVLAEAAKIAQKNLLGVAAIMAVLLEVSLMFLLLNSIDAKTTLAITEGISVTMLSLSAAMLIISRVPVAAAAQGVAGLAIVIAGIAAILAALGGLKQIPGFTWLMDEGTKVLGQIGNAIGQFVGSIIGGAMEGVTASLPKIGEDLSNFMLKATPFITGAKSIDSGVMDGVLSLAKVVLVLTAADILNGLTSWLTGGSSMVKFGEQLSQFAPYFKSFYEQIKNVKPDVIEGSANAAKALAEMAATLPNEGGLVAKFTGDNDLSVFAEKLKPFGKAMVEYADIVADLDPEVVIKSVTAAKALSELASGLPNTGGLAGWFMGNNDMDEFGRQLCIFGKKLATYSDYVKDLDTAVVIKSVDAAKALSELASGLPNTGGLAGWFMGNNDMDEFGKQLCVFGEKLAEYSELVSGVDPNVVKTSADAAKALSELANGLPTTGGLAGWFFGDNDLASFGKQLCNFGSSMKEFSDIIAGISLSNVTNLVDSCLQLIDLAKALQNVDTGVLKGFGKDASSFCKALESTGKNSMENFLKSITDNKPKIVTEIDTLLTTVLTKIEQTAPKIKAKAILLMNAFRDGIIEKIPYVKQAVQTMINAVVTKFSTEVTVAKFKPYGERVGTGFGDGIESKKSYVEDKASGIIKAVKDIFDAIQSSDYNTYGERVGAGFGDGISGQEGVVIAAASSLVAAANDQFATISKDTYRTYGAYVGQGYAEGIESELEHVAAAASSMVEVAETTTKKKQKSRSPSRLFMEIGRYVPQGFAIGIQNETAIVSAAAEEMVEGPFDIMSNAITKIYDMVQDEMDFTPTIVPVVDMGNVNKSIDTINSLFNESINIGKTNAISISGFVSRPSTTNTTDSNLQNAQSNGSNIVFNQYNTSPKALSRIDIYRDTRNLFAQAKGALS